MHKKTRENRGSRLRFASLWIDGNLLNQFDRSGITPFVLVTCYFSFLIDTSPDELQTCYTYWIIWLLIPAKSHIDVASPRRVALKKITQMFKCFYCNGEYRRRYYVCNIISDKRLVDYFDDILAFGLIKFNLLFQKSWIVLSHVHTFYVPSDCRYSIRRLDNRDEHILSQRYKRRFSSNFCIA